MEKEQHNEIGQILSRQLFTENKKRENTLHIRRTQIKN